MIQCIILVALVLLGCATSHRKMMAQLQHDKYSTFFETYEENEAKKRKLRTAIEKIQSQELTPKFTPPVVKLHPSKQLVSESTETVADSSDEWMHYYYEGLSKIAEGEYDRAIVDFERFMESDPSHPYRDRAHYWVIEGHYRNREYGLCVLSSNDFLARYPESLKQPDILYRRGLALSHMGQRISAVETFRELLAKFPSSGAAEGALARMAQMKSSREGG